MENLFFLPETLSSDVPMVDVLLLTGDAYVDHPSFGIAIIARVLADAGYSVAIWSQPDYKKAHLLNELPEVRLFIGISAGNLDSIVSNYTGARNRRREDVYSLDGNPFFPEGHRKRPDRATIVYTSYIKQRYKKIPVVLGGIEASLRRFAHYDYVQNKIRGSLLLDSKADLISYGMGEKSILEIARRLERGNPLRGIRGTVVSITKNELFTLQFRQLPSYEEILSSPELLLQATRMMEANMNPNKAKNLCQAQGGHYIFSFSPQLLFSSEELDRVYALPYRRNYPSFCDRIPAWRMIQNSVTSHRGCYGRCSFCAIASHQGPLIQSRSKASIMKEISLLASSPDFRGSISDIGGPTANMYASYCQIGGCEDPHCLYPSICSHLVVNQDTYVALLTEAKKIKGVKHLFITSGLRYDLLLTNEKATELIVKDFTSGHLKVAPEHFDNRVLKLMRKPPFEEFERFIRLFEKIRQKNHLNFFLLPYLILSHPGSDSESAHRIGQILRKHRIKTRQYQDFTPTPQTISTAMYVCGKDIHGNQIPVVKYSSAQNPQRKILEKYMKQRDT